MGELELPELDSKKSGRTGSGFRPGLILNGRYRLETLLGEGGMGTVWVGHQIALERRVAVKSLHVAAPAQRARLRREALALAAVHHPAIVEVYDYGETEAGLPYVVMELVRGESITARLHRLGALPAEEAVGIVLSILEGLTVAHKAGVVHRDIKPDNVVLAVDATPKLLDFGIARSDSDDEVRLTLDGNFVGTPAYMAPEQMRGAPADERVDVWGAGALLYHLIAGEAPFGTRDVVAVMRRVLEDPPSYPRRAIGLDGRLWAILTAALRKDPKERTASALAMRYELASWLDVRAPSLPRPSLSSEPPPLVVSTFAPTLLAQPVPSFAHEAPPSPRIALDSGPRIISASADASSDPDEAPPSFDMLIRSKLGR